MRGACPVENSTTGTVRARIVGIEVQSSCTYILLSAPNATLGLDTNPFIAGRFPYLALDRENTQYRVQLSIAQLALVTDAMIFAEYVSRFGRVTKISVSKEERPH